MTPQILKLLEVAKKATEEEADRARLNLSVRTNPRKWATYHLSAGGAYNLDGRKEWVSRSSILSFGGKMVKMVLENPGDLNTQEMSKLKWGQKFGWSPALLLAAVICHELTHAWMSKKNLNPMRSRYQRAIHGEDFYESLKNLFEDRVEDVALRIAELADDESLLEDRDIVLEKRTKVRKKRTRNPKPENFNIGDKVVFFSKSLWRLGVIKNWGGKTFTVIETRFGVKRKWYAPQLFLHPLEKLDYLISDLDMDDFLQRYQGQV